MCPRFKKCRLTPFISLCHDFYYSNLRIRNEIPIYYVIRSKILDSSTYPLCLHQFFILRHTKTFWFYRGLNNTTQVGWVMLSFFLPYVDCYRMTIDKLHVFGLTCCLLPVWRIMCLCRLLVPTLEELIPLNVYITRVEP